MNKKDSKTETAIQLIIDKFKETGRVPNRNDFDGPTLCFIKQKLGPWPRALESAGLKEKTKLSSKEKSKLKRDRISKNKKKAKEE